MIRSRNEVAGLVLKAGRGAGLPLGVAEELSEAAGAMDVGALEALAQYLETDEGRAALVAAISALDRGAETGLGAELLAALAAARAGEPGPTEPVEVPGEVWAVLERFAARVLVPESAGSRARGAGAGDIDND